MFQRKINNRFTCLLIVAEVSPVVQIAPARFLRVSAFSKGVLERMEAHQFKCRSMLRRLAVSKL